MLVNKDMCEIVLITNSTDYEFYAAIFLFKPSMWSVYCYHEMVADIDKQKNFKRLVAYGFLT